MSSNLSKKVYSFQEELVEKGFIVASYFLEIDREVDILSQAAAFAVGQSVGTWLPVPGITEEMLDRHLAKVVGVYDIPPIELRTHQYSEKQCFLIQIAFPEINFGSQFPMLFTTLLGNDVSTSSQLKLVDVQLSSTFVGGFSGPKFGIKGLREHLGIMGRPILMNMIKPCTGFSPDVGAAFFRDSARGGVDIIKDDELLGNPVFNNILERVKAYVKASEYVYQETGHRAIYCPNITDRVGKIPDNAKRVQDLGAQLVMVNTICTGLDVIQELASNENLSIPILSHFAGAGTLTENPSGGISSPLLLGKLIRLAGSDASMFSSIYSNYPLLRLKYRRIADYLTLPLFSIKPCMPVVGGGIRPSHVKNIMEDIGFDVILSVGGAIQGHPQGAAVGAMVMRQAIDAACAGISLEEYSENNSRLKTAIDAWGDKL